MLFIIIKYLFYIICCLELNENSLEVIIMKFKGLLIHKFVFK